MAPAPGRRRTAARGRGHSRRLDAAKIAAAALELVRREGLPQLTMRRLAAELGVDAAAVYWHFENKDALLDAVAEAAAEAVALPEPEGEDWRQRCVSLCHAIRDRLRRHPELQSGPTPWLGPFSATATASLARVLAEAGLRGDALFYSAQGLFDTIAAVVRSEASLGPASPEEVRRYVSSLADALPAELAGEWRGLARRDPEASFRAYLEELLGVLLDGVEVRHGAGR